MQQMTFLNHLLNSLKSYDNFERVVSLESVPIPHKMSEYLCSGCVKDEYSVATVAQLDARATGDQEVAGSTPAEVGNILSWRLIMKYFLRSFSPFR